VDLLRQYGLLTVGIPGSDESVLATHTEDWGAMVRVSRDIGFDLSTHGGETVHRLVFRLAGSSSSPESPGIVTIMFSGGKIIGAYLSPLAGWRVRGPNVYSLFDKQALDTSFRKSASGT
jgi:hypothetical protein